VYTEKNTSVSLTKITQPNWWSGLQLCMLTIDSTN